jgi:hypothetical protein
VNSAPTAGVPANGLAVTRADSVAVAGPGMADQITAVSARMMPCPGPAMLQKA